MKKYINVNIGNVNPSTYFIMQNRDQKPAYQSLNQKKRH